MTRLVLDAGALIGFDKGDVTVRAHLVAARRVGLEVLTTSPVIAQVWRDGRRQAMLARLLPALRIAAPDEVAARRAGELLAKSRTDDVVDALVIGLARDGDSILTSDAADLTMLARTARLRVTIIDV